MEFSRVGQALCLAPLVPFEERFVEWPLTRSERPILGHDYRQLFGFPDAMWSRYSPDV